VKHLMRYLGRLVVLVIVLVVGFFGLVLIMSELGGEVVTLHTQVVGGGEKRTHLWVVDDAGVAWLRAGMASSGWLARIEQNPNVLVERGGRLIRFRAVPVREPRVRDRIHALMREKYGAADRLVGMLRDPAQSVPVRLEPTGGARE
jgi:hypothetical protein